MGPAVAAGLLLSACGGGAEPGFGSDRAEVSTTTTFLDYKDAITRSLERRAREPRPVENSAMPPRHLDTERFPDVLVDRYRIVSGGPPPDGIPAIDWPSFSAVSRVDWLEEQEAVIVLQLGSEVRIYPVQILAWHEIVNDVVAGTPVAVTYCPLCNSAVAVERTVEGTVLDFGVSGALYDSAMVMFDRQTESLWTHFDGRAVVGTLIGTELALLPVAAVSWSTAARAFPGGAVLDRNTGFDKPYGRNRYVAYDQAEAPLPGFFTERVSDELRPMDRVVGIRHADVGAAAVPLATLRRRRVMHLSDDVVVVWRSGTASSLQASTVAGGDDVGATGVFSSELDGRALRITEREGEFVDTETGSTWDVLGKATSGPLTGRRLDPIEHLDTFWFAWASYVPNTIVVE